MSVVLLLSVAAGASVASLRPGLSSLVDSGVGTHSRSHADDGRPWSAAQFLGEQPLAVYGLSAVPTPSLGMDDLGWGFAVTADKHVEVHRAAPGRGFGAPVAVPASPGAQELSLDVAGDGVAAIAWLQFDGEAIQNANSYGDSCCVRVDALIANDAGRVSPARILSSRGSAASNVVLGSSGNQAGIAWVDPKGLGISTGSAADGFAPARGFAGGGQTPVVVWFASGSLRVLTFDEFGHLREIVGSGAKAREYATSATLPRDSLITPVANSSSGTAIVLINEPSHRNTMIAVISPGLRSHIAFIEPPRPYSVADFETAAFAPDGQAILIFGLGRQLAIFRVGALGALRAERVLAIPAGPRASVGDVASAAINDRGRIAIAGFAVEPGIATSPLNSWPTLRRFAVVVGSGVSAARLGAPLTDYSDQLGAVAAIDTQGQARVAFDPDTGADHLGPSTLVAQYFR